MIFMLFYSNFTSGQVCTCSSCEDCTNALINSSCTEVKLTADISNFVGTCINNPPGFNNKTFDCQGHTIDGDDSEEEDYGIYLYNQNNTIKNCVITDFYYGIYLQASSNNILTNNTARSNNYGIDLYFSSNNILINNTANFNNGYGIFLQESQNNFLVYNIISLNYMGGIYLYSSGLLLGSDTKNNNIYNNFFNNTNNFGFGGTIYPNKWNTTKTAVTNIVGGYYLGGNFWAKPDGTGFSQTCIDNNKDGICDSSYILAENNTDYLPLSTRFISAFPEPPEAPIGPPPPPPLPPQEIQEIIGAITVQIISPTKLCGGNSNCCSNNGLAAYYYNASKAIWHNITVTGTPTGINWSWYGNDSVVNILRNTSDDFSKANISHIYSLKQGKNTTNVLINFTIINKTTGKVINSLQIPPIPLTNCQSFQPIVNITSPTATKYLFGNIWHNATWIDADSSYQNLTFRWNIFWDYGLFNNSVCTYTRSGCPNISLLFNYTGNFTSQLIIADEKGQTGWDVVRFSVINESCNCSNPFTYCKSWNLSRQDNERRYYCNERGQWINYCLNSNQCKEGEYCNSTKQCSTKPTECQQISPTSGCEVYNNENDCISDVCDLGKNGLEPPGCDLSTQKCTVYSGCSWNSINSICEQSFTAIDPTKGAQYTCSYSTKTEGDCSEAGTEAIKVTYKFSSNPPNNYENDCCRDYGFENCQNGEATITIQCAQLPSRQMPGFTWINVLGILVLLAGYYIYKNLKKKTNRKTK
ncbi:MAG: NosD domain-containing protein [Candidatus Pacearchaeota archaeon]